MRSLSAAFRPHHKAGSLVRGAPTNEYADTARPNQRRGVRETGQGGSKGWISDASVLVTKA